jgi:hypothetical protein
MHPPERRWRPLTPRSAPRRPRGKISLCSPTACWQALFSSPGIGCSKECPRPSGALSFGTGEDCFQQSVEHDVTGTFTGTPGGFRIDSVAGGSLVISGLTAVIPDGTFVRARFECSNDVWSGGAGQFLQIDNVPAIDGMPNPTEDGARLWLVAAGGRGHIPSDFRFALEAETACHAAKRSEEETKDPEVARLTLSGEGVSVTAEPEETAPFTIDTGSYAGSYQLHNVKAMTTYYGCCHASVSRNFTITRAD